MRGLALLTGSTAVVLSLGCTPSPEPTPPEAPWWPAPTTNVIVARPPEAAAQVTPGFTGCFEPRIHPKRMSLSDGLLLDLDRDGRRDLVAIGMSGGPQYEESLFVLSGGAAGDFALRSREKVPPGWMGVVIGDFNATPMWPAYKRLATHFTDAAISVAQAKGRPVLPTWGWQGGRRRLRLDHAFTRGIRAEHFEVVPLEGSDHSAIVVDLVG